jgi:hypothetical protein
MALMSSLGAAAPDRETARRAQAETAKTRGRRNFAALLRMV